MLVGCLALSAYFAHHAIGGRHGLATRARLTERATVLERDLARLEARRSVLRRDVALLASEPPHADMVEEIARGVLGFLRHDERMLAPASAAVRKP
jgi:cell division protein FtsB